ncbi:TraB/GumN family protein [Vulcaniibacterium thermophilum]|uniref:Pheromone shutdown protein n=1 Tax=Vulcaniibacterium thermophilum TaxID=1169913 RepID=A0A918Z4K5_9GAMM|nr:TraB/GumN family protein [Vulcaniibacterium thermophilum]GHE34022.1 pheromone shutdown protein [Vulcaniibacterium thermophilum]
MSATPDPAALVQSQPHAVVERDGVRYTLLGTAHVSQASVDAVRDAIASGRFDAVAVELDEHRLVALTDPDALARMDLIEVLRTGRTPMFAANLALAAYQRRLAEQLAIEPGAELKRAVLEARQRDLPVHLIDRDVGRTFRRAWGRLGFWARARLGGGLLGALLAREEVDAEDIEKLKQGDLLESTFSEFATGSPALYETVIAERDRYMAARLRQSAGNAREVLAVVGAGHLAGLSRHLRADADAPERICETLDAIPPKSRVPWFTLALAAFVLGGFAWGFWRGGLEVGSDLLLEWTLTTMALGALGCALAGGHPLSILVAALASPVTPLHPALASGMLSALTEAWLRKPTHADFLALRDDVTHWRGWWRNRVARVLLNFFLTSMGTAIGVWIGGARMLGTLFG